MLLSGMKKLSRLALPLLFALLTACGGGSGDGSSGEVVVGLTDAEGDFLRYEVDVVALQLVRDDGLVVDTLPVEATPVDFASLVEVTEFLTAATVPDGVYRRLSLSLDYSRADIAVELGGAAVSAAAVDEAGQSLTSLEIAVELADDRPLVVAPGIPAHLTLDFDLLATNRVDTLSVPPQVTVLPLLVAEVNPESPKIHRLRGPLLRVNEAEQQFSLAVRAHRRLRRDFGQLQVQADADTVYEINGEPALGPAGLALLAEVPVGTAVVVLGDLQPRQQRFVAREVYAGSSVPGGSLEAITGTVIARRGDLLTLQGCLLDRGDDSRLERGAIQVQLAADTRVTAQLSPLAAPAVADISVGQRLVALGSFDERNGTLTAAGVRLLLSGLSGFVAANDSDFAVDLVTLGGVGSAGFDFTGTGSSAAEDADPAFYQVAVDRLDLDALSVGDPVHVRGFVSPFGLAPPDFNAASVADASAVLARLRFSWQPPTSSGVSVAADLDSLILDPAEAGRAHHVIIAGVPVELPADTPLSLLPAAENGIYALAAGGPSRIYRDFAIFAAALADQLAQGAAVAAVSAGGDYDRGLSTFTTRRLGVVLDSSRVP